MTAYYCGECGNLIQGGYGHRLACSQFPVEHWWNTTHEAQAAADEAIAAAEAHANEMWKETALVVVWQLARHSQFFTADNVWEALTGYAVATHEPRALGAIMQRAVKEGYIKATDAYRPSWRAACHGRPVRVWESRIFQREERTA